jgi:hypothetical protein
MYESNKIGFVTYDNKLISGMIDNDITIQRESISELLDIRLSENWKERIKGIFN